MSQRTPSHSPASLCNSPIRAAQLASGRTDALTAGIVFSRPLRRGSVFYISYDSTRQVSKGPTPISANMDRNQVTIGFDYRLKTFSLGQ